MVRQVFRRQENIIIFHADLKLSRAQLQGKQQLEKLFWILINKMCLHWPTSLHVSGQMHCQSCYIMASLTPQICQTSFIEV